MHNIIIGCFELIRLFIPELWHRKRLTDSFVLHAGSLAQAVKMPLLESSAFPQSSSAVNVSETQSAGPCSELEFRLVVLWTPLISGSWGALACSMGQNVKC